VAESDTIGPSRAEQPLVLAIDIGSSSIRGAIHDRLGRMVRGTDVQVSYAWDTAPDGSVRRSHQAFLDIVDQALDALDAAVERLHLEVGVGGISCFIHSIVGLDGEGRPMTPVLSWADTTSSGEAAALRTRFEPGAVHAMTGAPIHASYWPARILRLRTEQPGIRQLAGLPALVIEHLTGRQCVSRSMASGTGMLDRATGDWSQSMLDAIELEPKQLSPIMDDAESLGTFSTSASARWPRLRSIRWFGAWGDGGCGNVGLGATGGGRAALMVGTSGAMRTIVGTADPVVPAGLFAQRLGAGTVVGGQLSEGGGTLAWASGLLRRSQASLERSASALDADRHGLTVLPYTFGERGLGYHDDARGAIVGLSPGTDAADIYRAFLESIAAGFAAVDARLTDVLGAAPAVIAAGGTLEHSPLLTQILADSLGRDIGIARGVESSRRGAAVLALWASGAIADISAVPAPSTRRVHANPDRAARYLAARGRRDALYGTLLT
jgi:gluconokinase